MTKQSVKDFLTSVYGLKTSPDSPITRFYENGVEVAHIDDYTQKGHVILGINRSKNGLGLDDWASIGPDPMGYLQEATPEWIEEKLRKIDIHPKERLLPREAVLMRCRKEKMSQKARGEKE